MSETKDQDKKKTLSLAGKSKLSLKGTPGSGKVRQSFSHGRSKTVAVEVKRTKRGERPNMKSGGKDNDTRSQDQQSGLTSEEREARARALLEAEKRRQESDKGDESVGVTRPKSAQKKEEAKKDDKKAEAAKEEEKPVDLREKELEELRKIQEAEEQKRKEEAERLKKEEEERNRKAAVSKPADESTPASRDAKRKAIEEEEEKRTKRKPGKLSATARGRRRQDGKLTVTQAQNFDQFEESNMNRGRSLAAQRRARERERMKARQNSQPMPTQKISREVTVPETITVQELANRMAERSGEVVKKLMEMGVMATINQIVDADTAELICEEFGHKIKRVSEADVEIGMTGDDDKEEDLQPRPPVVTVMGHVDHGKTSLLDALRKTDVVAGEAGGITQHIGAYQITLENEQKITFIDTPGHEAFSEMRSRGADITDIVVLVVAANDSVKPQTIEAINHARAAEVPVIVAINKCDLPDADPDKVRQDLLQHEIIVESYSGDVQDVEVSAITGDGLKELEETILLQAEILELKANPNRKAIGAVVEAKVEHGRGSVATVLIKKGTLHVGDVFVTGCEDGRVRAMVDDHGTQVEEAIPGQPVEVLGLNGTPEAGDDFVVVNDEARAREIAEFRGRRKREVTAAGAAKGTNLEQLFSQLKEDEIKKMDVIIKGDVHGSIEAIKASLEKLTQDNEEVSVRVLHMGVGAINNSDVTLANTTNALIIGFNVRANDQAREMAQKDKVDIRYFSVIYDAIDEVRNILSGMLEPSLREKYLGRAEIRQVFSVGKTGKVAGCMVLDGNIKRGAGVRLLRDNVVIHEGKLKSLRRFKDEVKDVREGFECGMAFENYDDIKEGDVIEAFEVEEVAREL